MFRTLSIAAVALAASIFAAPAQAAIINSFTAGTTTASTVSGEASEAVVNSILTNQDVGVVELGRAIYADNGALTFSGLGFGSSLGLGDPLSGTWTISGAFAETFADFGVLAVAAVFGDEFVLIDFSASTEPVLSGSWCVDGRCVIFDEEGTAVLLLNEGINLTTFDQRNIRVIDSVILFGNTLDAINGVPEAGTWLLMLMGFGGVALALRRRRTALLA